jgi:hypothetical protein
MCGLLLFQPARTYERCAPAGAGSRGQKKAPCHSQEGANFAFWKIWRGARHEGTCIRALVLLAHVPAVKGGMKKAPAMRRG